MAAGALADAAAGCGPRSASAAGRGAVAGELDQRRQQIDQRHRRRDAARREAAGRVHDQRHAAGALEEAHLVPEAALAQHLAVVGEQQRRSCRRRSPRLAQRLEHRGRPGRRRRRRRRNRRGARRAPAPRSIVAAVHAADMAQPARMRVDRRPRSRRDARHVDLVVAVAVPVLAAGWRTGRADGSSETTRQNGPVVAAARDVEQLAARRRRPPPRRNRAGWCARRGRPRSPSCMLWYQFGRSSGCSQSGVQPKSAG